MRTSEASPVSQLQFAANVPIRVLLDPRRSYPPMEFNARGYGGHVREFSESEINEFFKDVWNDKTGNPEGYTMEQGTLIAEQFQKYDVIAMFTRKMLQEKPLKTWKFPEDFHSFIGSQMIAAFQMGREFQLWMISRALKKIG